MKRDIDLSVSGEILTYFHMIYEECIGYLKKHPGLPTYEGLRVILLTLWHMFSELEQMHYLVSAGVIHPEERERIEDFIERMRKALYPKFDNTEVAALRRQVSYLEPEVNYVLNKYVLRAERLGRYRTCIPGNER